MEAVTMRESVQVRQTQCATVDLGCGNRKLPGALGVDVWAGAEVDVIADLDKIPWPLEGDAFDRIVCRHVIEHVNDVVTFLSEIHRIGRNGAMVEVSTPHFSSTHSWKDPTHRRHLSLEWHELFGEGGYLTARTGAFAFVSRHVTFSSSLYSQVGRLLYRVLGASRWEKHMAFRWPAREFETVLQIVK
jgi:SAM-dependent methyltransferase